MIHYSPNGSYPSRMSPSSKLSVKKTLKSRHKRAICSFLDDEVGVTMIEWFNQQQVVTLPYMFSIVIPLKAPK